MCRSLVKRLMYRVERLLIGPFTRALVESVDEGSEWDLTFECGGLVSIQHKTGLRAMRLPHIAQRFAKRHWCFYPPSPLAPPIEIGGLFGRWYMDRKMNQVYAKRYRRV